MQLIAIDLDGTLCNTIEDIAGSLNRALYNYITISDIVVMGFCSNNYVS